MLSSISLLLLSLTSVSALRYGHNYVLVRKDNESIAANFQNVPYELFSPAFISPDTVPASFSNGTAGPTDDATLGN